MSKFLTLFLTSCTVVSSNAAAHNLSKEYFENHSYIIFYKGGIIHDPACKCRSAGIAYSQAIDTSLIACDWSEHESGNEPGCAYREGAAAAEDADCHEDHE